MMLVRYRDHEGAARVGVIDRAGVRRLAVPTLADLLGGDRARLEAQVWSAGPVEPAVPELLAPIDGATEVWAAGVTYRRSRDARIEESTQADPYQLVYSATRPELFFKSVAWRVSGPRQPVAIRADSTVDVPEPELALVTTATGEIAGYTLCNDVSSRSIEGENPLYLPQAKVYAGACALGPGIVLAGEVSDPADLVICLEIRRDGRVEFAGHTHTGELIRPFADLVAWLYAEQHFPAGVVLSTGTGIVPELGFTLREGDEVTVRVDGIGELTNPVVRGKQAMAWQQPGPRDVPERRGVRVNKGAEPGVTSAAEVRAACARALDAADGYAALPLPDRAELLRRAAAALATAEDEIADLADSETHLGRSRLISELGRTTAQLRLFADAVAEGSFLEASIDPRGEARPDLRRMLVSLGPVAVFAASNFPLAFSVAGGDTASALAAGCPVVVKAHEGHPRLSALVQRLLAPVFPPGVLDVVYGRQAGRDLVLDEAIAAVGFTGSAGGGRALLDLANTRASPIPFYGEFGSINPVVVTAAAADQRGDAIADGFIASFTLGRGQFCTKPGVLFVPTGHPMVARLVRAVAACAPGPLLGEWIHNGFSAALEALLGQPGVRELARGRTGDGAAPVLLGMPAAEFGPATATECFGPASLVVEYDTPEQLFAALDQVRGSLTVTVHTQLADDRALTELVVGWGQRHAGRIIVDGWPTGVPVGWATHHGGPWPATSSPLHTSVGVTAIRRFLRPVAYQDVPEPLLPPALRDDNPLGIPRRIDGYALQPPRQVRPYSSPSQATGSSSSSSHSLT